MKSKIVLIITLFLTISVFQQTYAQESTKGLSKEEKKALKERKRAIEDSLKIVDYQKALLAIKDTMFVLEAQKVEDKYGNQNFVTQATNFVSVQKDEVTIQLAFPTGSGANGLGGITMDGKINRLIIEETKKGAKKLRLNVTGTGLNGELTIMLYPGANKADATLTAKTYSSRLKYYGVLLRTTDSLVFKGTTYR